jgi:hypothetical protein
MYPSLSLLASRQVITCTASTGSFVLKFGVSDSATFLAASATVGELQLAMNAFPSIIALGQSVLVTSQSSTDRLCLSSTAVTAVAFQAKGDPEALRVDGSQLGAAIYGSNDLRDGAVSVQETIKGSVGIKYVPDSEGLYELTYVPVVKGLYSLTITIGGSVIETDTTAGVFVVPARASGPHSTHDAEPIAIEDVTEPFTIQVCVALRVVP